MSYQVLVSDNAKNDLEGIADYICNSLYAPVAAQKILKKLQDSILGLSVFPERYPIYAEEPWQSRGVRKMNDGNYKIFYVVQKIQVVVLRVFYVGQDVPSLLNEPQTNYKARP